MSTRAWQRLAWLLGAMVALMLWLVPAHPYEWMREFDPTLQQLPADPVRDVRLGITLVAVLVAVTVLARTAYKAGPGRAGAVSGVLAFILVAAWVWKFAM